MSGTPGSEVDLNVLARRGDPDWSLERLLHFAASGFGMAITVVVGGTLISGLLGNERDWAEHLDAGLARVMHDHAENVDELFAEIRALGFAAEAEEQEAEFDRVRAEVEKVTTGSEDWKLTDLPAETAREAAVELYGRTAFTLTDARVVFPLGGSLEVGQIRVLVAHVGAWWAGGLMPAPAEPEG